MAKKSKAFGAKHKKNVMKSDSNPFDFKFQRKRHNVIGANRSGVNSTPLGTRKIFHELRKKTIGKELKQLNRKKIRIVRSGQSVWSFKDRKDYFQGKIYDERLGQRNLNLTANEKAEMRLVAQRKHQLKSNRNKFLLNDEDDGDLEYLASGLTEAEKFQRGEGNEAIEEEELDSELMARASFGGGSLKMESEGDKAGKRLSRHDLIKQAIERSVQAKAIKKHDRIIQFDQWEKLDQQFDELKKSGKLSFGRVDMEKEEGDDEYMELFQQLGSDHKVPAKREWASDITRRDIEGERAKEVESPLQLKEHPLYRAKDELTFPAAVYRIQSTRVRNSLDLAQLLLVCNDVAVFLEDNRRYCPEVIGFLLNTLMLANAPPITGSTNTTLLSTFSTTDHFLYFNERSKLESVAPLSIKSLKQTDNPDLSRDRLLDLQVIRVTVRMVCFFAQLYDNLSEAYPIIFSQFRDQLALLPTDNYPESLQKEVKDALKIVTNSVQERSKLIHLHRSAAQKIKTIDMLEPRIEQHFNARHPTHKRDDPNTNVKRLQKKLKRETRGTIKELRRDARFIEAEQSSVRRQVNEERQKKTNQILASLQTQESEFKKRKKGKKF